MYIFDTNHLILLLKKPNLLTKKSIKNKLRNTWIHAIALSEYHWGTILNLNNTKQQLAEKKFIKILIEQTLGVIEFSEDDAELVRNMALKLKKKQKSLEAKIPKDIMIAATAKRLNCILLSDDKRFRKIEDLCGIEIENWYDLAED